MLSRVVGIAIVLLSFGSLRAQAPTDEQLREIKVIAFDLFGTVFDYHTVPSEQMKAYVDHVHRPEWSPLQLPDEWIWMKPYYDSADGIEELRKHYLVVTCSNAPIGLQMRLSKKAGISWDGYIPLEAVRRYKPHPDTYRQICDVLSVNAAEVLLVTGNPTAGDVEIPRTMDMCTILIRRDKDGPRTIIDLANKLNTVRESREAAATAK